MRGARAADDDLVSTDLPVSDRTGGDPSGGDPSGGDRRAAGHRRAPAGLRRLALSSAAVTCGATTALVLVPSAPVRALLVCALLCWTAAVVLRATRLLRPFWGASSWTVLAAGQLLHAAGWATWLLLPALGHPAPAWSGDVLFLSAYGLSVGGLLALGGLRRHRDRLAALDTAVLAVALGVLVWALVGSSLSDASPSATVAAVAVAYPALDVLLLAFALRVVLAGTADLRTGLLLAWAASQALTDGVWSVRVL